MPQPFIATRNPTSAMRILLLLFCFMLLGEARAEALPVPYDDDYQAARKTYRARHYEDAVRMLDALLKAHPDCARCAHLLGKSYGRLAQRANWLAAMDLARKTCSALELAVRLDPEDEGAVEDLLRYYHAAPAFLGGGADKARIMEQQLERLKAKGAS
jgi:tetratricopeptide (TPR) repeat protein